MAFGSLDLQRSDRRPIDSFGRAVVDTHSAYLFHLAGYGPCRSVDRSMKLTGVVDIIISLAWFAVFGLIVDALNEITCGRVFDWDSWRINFDNFCGHWRAAEAFSFLSAVIWLVSGLLVCFTLRTHAQR